MGELTYLDVSSNQIADLIPLAGLSKLNLLYAQQNRIADLSPPEQNSGVGSGDWLLLTTNLIDCGVQAHSIAALLGRGVALFSDCP